MGFLFPINQISHENNFISSNFLESFKKSKNLKKVGQLFKLI